VPPFDDRLAPVLRVDAGGSALAAARRSKLLEDGQCTALSRRKRREQIIVRRHEPARCEVGCGEGCRVVTAAGFRDPPTTAGMTRSSVSRNVSRSDGAIPKMRY
jgi:hypothetical protein